MYRKCFHISTLTYLFIKILICFDVFLHTLFKQIVTVYYNYRMHLLIEVF
jgi:hypothetical protein